jgi:hypothetical protein
MRRLFLTCFVLAIASGAHVSAQTAQTGPFLDRSAQAQQFQVDPQTGEMLAVPASYRNVRAPNRGAQAGALQLDAENAITATPGSYPGLGAPDRGTPAGQVVVEEGQLTQPPALYPSLGGSDRGNAASNVGVDPETFEFQGQPASYGDLNAAHRFAAETVAVNPASGEMAQLPATYPADYDADGIPDPSDRCPFFQDPDQLDVNENGRGDACECGDQSGDGRLNVGDLVAINRAIFAPALATPLCDSNNDDRCNVNDIVAANQSLFLPKTATCARQPVPGP